MSNRTVWGEVDAYIEDRLLGDDKVLEQCLQGNIDGGLPNWDVSPAQGKLLQLLVSMCGAKRVLEIGTLGGYSTICMARGLPDDGKLISLEYEARYAKVATQNIANAGFADKVEVRVGEAAVSLPKLEAEGGVPFDFVFIDADKPNNPVYLDWALRLARKGAVIVCDNVVRDGDIVDASYTDSNVQGARDAFEFIAKRGDLVATAIQTVGSKGYDGFAILIAP